MTKTVEDEINALRWSLICALKEQEGTNFNESLATLREVIDQFLTNLLETSEEGGFGTENFTQQMEGIY